jgi:hypothetical protein
MPTASLSGLRVHDPVAGERDRFDVAAYAELRDVSPV